MMKSQVSIQVVRAIFLVISVIVGITVASGFQMSGWIGGLAGAGFMGVLMILDLAFARFSMRDFSHATFGLLIGVFCAWLITRIGLFELAWVQTFPDGEAISNVARICTYAALAFFGVTFALRSHRDQFALLIPYVRFRRDASEGEPILLDSNVIIDGRIGRVVKSGFLTGTLVIPRFVLDELQRLADSSELMKTERGKRGLAVVEKLRELRDLDLTIHEDVGQPDAPVDTRLANLARSLNARLLTNDENLIKVARLRGVVVLSFKELALALQPELAAGDELELSLIKPGKDKHQAIGYLADGSMIVVNHAAEKIGETVSVVISGALPTSAGRLVFAELK
jgi:uncharacterized protein YacL